MAANLPARYGPINRTIRLVTSARLREPVLKQLVGEDLAEIARLAEIEAVTSGRLIATNIGLPPLGPDDFVGSDVPSHRFINAAFVYPRPDALNRFNGPARGAWYAAFELDTAIAEVAYHLEKELRATNRANTSVEYAELFATIDGKIIDLTATSAKHDCISQPDDFAYPAGNRLAVDAMQLGFQAIVYPSARRLGGVCVAALFPKAISKVTEGDVHRLSWTNFSLNVTLACNKL
jgi:RES domain